MLRKILLCFALTVIIALPASGKIQHIGSLTADVPSGWTIEQQGTVTIIKSLAKNASVAVAVNPLGEASLSDIAGHLYSQMNGRNLERDSDGYYSFSFTNTSGAEGLAILTDSLEGRYILMSISGYEDESVKGELDEIIDSLDWND